MRSRVERWFGTLGGIGLWLQLLATWYKWIRPHQTIGTPPGGLSPYLNSIEAPQQSLYSEPPAAEQGLA